MEVSILIRYDQAINQEEETAMSMGNNIQFFRKKLGMTQEAFAEKLQVTRQTISKWESDAGFPEMEKLLQLCDLFGTDLDTLTRGNAEQHLQEDTMGYDKEMNSFTRAICVGTALVLLGVVLTTLLTAVGINELFAGMALMTLILFAAVLFIVSGIRHGDYVKKHPQIVPFYTQQQVDAFGRKFPFFIAVPTALILLGIVWMMGLEAVPAWQAMGKEKAELLSLALFLLTVTVAAPLYIYGGMQQYKYHIEEYNASNARTPENLRKEKWTGVACGSIMMLATIVYLVTGLGQGTWKENWIVFAVGGMLCGIASMVIPAVVKKRADE